MYLDVLVHMSGMTDTSWYIQIHPDTSWYIVILSKHCLWFFRKFSQHAETFVQCNGSPITLKGSPNALKHGHLVVLLFNVEEMRSDKRTRAAHGQNKGCVFLLVIERITWALIPIFQELEHGIHLLIWASPHGQPGNRMIFQVSGALKHEAQNCRHGCSKKAWTHNAVQEDLTQQSVLTSDICVTSVR